MTSPETQETTTPVGKGDVRALLHHDHDRLDRLRDDLLDAAAADVDILTLGDVWRQFADGLERHMAAEEELLFPLVVGTHPDDVAALKKDHTRIRALLEELDVAVDLHFVREPALKTLAEVVRAHSEREDDTLYRWAQTELSEPHRATLWDRLTNWL